MKDSDPRSAPPIPPRRLKRKNKSMVSVTNETVIGEVRSERRPQIPPPPPPQRLSRVRADSSRINCRNDGKSSGDFAQGHLSTFGKPLGTGSGKKPEVKKREKTKIPRPEEYPPLFFTLQDFQEVMEGVENSYSRTLKNMTTFEPIPRPRRTRILNGELPESPDREDQMLFRVTTTDLPFEKCRSEWAEESDDPNHFVFEEYVDRRQKPPKPRPKSNTKLVLFGDDTFDKDEEEQSFSASHTASRVRFRVDPPTVVYRDEKSDKNTELDSLQNIESLPMDCQMYQDDFGDVPFDSLLDPNNGDTEYLGIEPSEDSASSNTDFKTILVTATVEPLPVIEVAEEPCENDKEFHVAEDDSKSSEKAEETKVPEELVPEFMGDFDDEGDKSVPEKLRRSSFLMNMLEGDEAESSAVCKVVATHPKTPIHKMTVVENCGGVGNAEEAKSKLLGELSSSFGVIKLKPVNLEETVEKLCVSDLKIDGINEGEDLDGANHGFNQNLDSVLNSKCNLNEEPIEESRRSRIKPQDRSNVCSQKTDQPIIDRNVDIIYNGGGRAEDNDEINSTESRDDDNEDNSGKLNMNMNNNNNENNVELASVISVDKCAIVLQCNDNNDNNAMTPVDVSYDQSQNNVSIIPGSVRSFVKFYEIRGETSSVGLNSDTALVPKIKVEAVEDLDEINESNTVTSPVGIEIENDIKYTIVRRRSVTQEILRNEHGQKPQEINHDGDKSDKSNQPSSTEVKLCQIDGKRDPQFHIGDDILTSATIKDIETTGKKGSEKTTRVTQTCTSDPRTAPGIEDGSASGLTRDVVRSGTKIKSVPKSSTSTINEQNTFYCTV